MPSDLVWVALISSGAALLASILTARFTAASTKRQIDAQADDRKQHIKHEVDEARRNRMIEARRGNLMRLQESMAMLFGAHNTFTSSVIGLQTLTERGIPPDDPGRKAMADEVQRQVGIIQDETTNITALRPRLSDQELIAIVDELTAEIGRIVHGGEEALTAANLPGRMLGQFEGLVGLRRKLPPFNKRIEELLIGDDLT